MRLPFLPSLLALARLALPGLLALGLAAQALAQGPALDDDAGQRIELARPAARIVALSPTATELAYAAGAGGKLVGVAAFSDWPKAAARLPVIGRYDGLDVEAILALRPDLAIAWDDGNRPAELQRLARLGVPVLHLKTRAIEDVARHLRWIGELAGTKKAAGKAAQAFLQSLSALPRPQGGARMRVFIELWDHPLSTLSGPGIVEQALARCGGQNLFGGLPGQAPSVSLEAVLAADPEAIIATGMTGARADWLLPWQRWPQLSAVRHGRLYTIDPDLLFRAGPRLAEGLHKLCAMLHR
jgi:iron complex transport system substrate-binding protein